MHVEFAVALLLGVLQFKNDEESETGGGGTLLPKGKFLICILIRLYCEQAQRRTEPVRRSHQPLLP